MMDLDDRLQQTIAQKAPSVLRHKADFIFAGIPREFYQTFDAVVLDPPWDYYRLWCFLDKAMFCLKDHQHARIFLSYCSIHLETREKKMHRFHQKLAKRGFLVESIEPFFNLYSLEPAHQPEVQKRLDALLPLIDVPLLDLIRHVPYAYAPLYVLRRNPVFRPNRLKKWFFAWWNRA